MYFSWQNILADISGQNLTRAVHFYSGVVWIFFFDQEKIHSLHTWLLLFQASCDFCKFAANTAADSFGRLESEHGVIVSNTFKIERYHGLALLKTHSPIVFSQLQFVDLMKLSMKWFLRTNELGEKSHTLHSRCTGVPKGGWGWNHVHELPMPSRVKVSLKSQLFWFFV